MKIAPFIFTGESEKNQSQAVREALKQYEEWQAAHPSAIVIQFDTTSAAAMAIDSDNSVYACHTHTITIGYEDSNREKGVAYLNHLMQGAILLKRITHGALAPFNTIEAAVLGHEIKAWLAAGEQFEKGE